jgi:hypothetical protein
VKWDDEVSQNIGAYAKNVDGFLQAVDGSVFQQCLRSERGSEFSNLCRERQELEKLELDGRTQLLLASAVLEKNKAASKAFEALVMRPESGGEKKGLLEKIKENREENAKLTESLKGKIESIEEICREIQQINTEQIEFENVDILVKKETFFNIKVMEIRQLIEEQEKNRGLALAGLILEQDDIQQEYDKLFSIQAYFEEINELIEHRIAAYPAYKSKVDSTADTRQVVDQRNFLLNALYTQVEGSPTTTLKFNDLTSALEDFINKRRKAEESSTFAVETFLAQAEAKLSALSTVTQQIKEQYFTEEYFTEFSALAEEIDLLEHRLEKFTSEFETAHQELIVSPAGLSERQLFVDYLLADQPGFLKECDLLP